MTKPSLPLGPPGARTAGPINHRGFVCRGEIKTDPVTSRGRAAGPFFGWLAVRLGLGRIEICLYFVYFYISFIKICFYRLYVIFVLILVPYFF